MDGFNAETVPKNIKEVNVSFARLTTYGCGGNAREAYFPQNVKQAERVYDYLTENKIKFVILGNGSNVLASDNFFDGAVINTKKLTGIYRTDRGSIVCRAGTTVNALMKFCVSNGFGGLEYLAGIPATCGGLAYMNAGAGGQYISENIVAVSLYDGKIHKFSNKRCNFGYKYSTMRNINSIITGIELSVCPSDSESIRLKVKQALDRRKSLPKGKSCGCVFKNYGAISAGKIIDEAGLKGLSVGKAYVSYDHANFIINDGASASDVKLLIRAVKQKVFERTGIRLEEEVVYIGDN